MKFLIFIFLICLAGVTALGAEKNEVICGIKVKADNIVSVAAIDQVTVLDTRELIGTLDGTIESECFAESGAYIVASYPDGEVIAYKF